MSDWIGLLIFSIMMQLLTTPKHPYNLWGINWALALISFICLCGIVSELVKRIRNKGVK